ncbi:MAG: aminoacetone oxidase family FAD-binding enzyme, partial [Vicinamibacteria bacterium]|nr:aminoacetone oxidase family FAD-binding enzyme [Vicinamibacteria bacterium]
MTASIIAQAPGTHPADVRDLVVVGGGAAGLATAIFAARLMRGSLESAAGRPPVVVLDSARSLGAKILVSGGSRCNVTNARVDAADFWRSGSPFVRQVLHAFPVSETIAFFDEIGVALKEEPLGKLFPVTNKARTVLSALIAEAERLGIEIRTSCRVLGIERREGGWSIAASTASFRARSLVLATGGLSLPKTGSDGFGYSMARAQGHTIVPTVPALEPLILGGEFHAPLSGITHEAA